MQYKQMKREKENDIENNREIELNGKKSFKTHSSYLDYNIKLNKA